MRCSLCGWIAAPSGCPCGALKNRGHAERIPIGTRVLARLGRGPSPANTRWERGEVAAHVGPVHRVDICAGALWCEIDDVFPLADRSEGQLGDGARVWALWVDGRWYPGTVDRVEGPLRHIAFDDGDSIWLEARTAVAMAVLAPRPEIGEMVLARDWEGEYRPGAIEERDGSRYRIAFSDGEESWVGADAIHISPPNPFADSGQPA